MSSRPQRPSDIRILSARASFDDVIARTAFSFGASVASTITRCHVQVLVENRQGQRASGWGAIFLSHPWAFPGNHPDDHLKNQFMRRLVERICARVEADAIHQHPVDLFWDLQFDLASIGEQVAREVNIPYQIPVLATLVCASPVDAAVHDAFGIVNVRSVYDGYGRDGCSHDLSAYLGPAFRDRYITDYLRPTPAPVVHVAHTVGGFDPLTAEEIPPGQPDDGLPRSLANWIKRDGVQAFKVKLHGGDLDRDLMRLIAVHRVAKKHSGLDRGIHLSVDLNEQCPSADYAREYLDRLAASAPDAFAALDYVEQPAPRDMIGFPVDVSAIAAVKPVMLDEGLTSIPALELAHELGWNAVALKTCKCQSLMLLVLAWATEHQLRVTVQDLSNPGLALLQSLSLASRLPDIAPMEANARQFFPAASGPESEAHPEVFRARDGVLHTMSLTGPGFGYQLQDIARPLFHQDGPTV